MILKVLQTIFLLFVLVFVYIVKESGAFREIAIVNGGQETIIDTPPGIEDITIDQENAKAYFSSHNRRLFSQEGMIYGANLSEPQLKLKPLINSKLPFNFRPHGISIFTDSNGIRYLFVVNHENDLNSILRFRIQNDSLVFEKRFVHDLILFPNDVLATGLNSFYVSNDHTIPNNFRRKLGDFLLEKSGNVVYFQDQKAAVVTQNMAYANGLNISPDHRFLYVAATTENKLYVYSHSQDFAERKCLDQQYLGTAPDNIEIDKNGSLWVACHPKLLKYLSHAKNKDYASPSEIIKVSYQPTHEKKFSQERIYVNDGSSISGSSVGAFFETDSIQKLIIGSVFEEKVLTIENKTKN